MKDQEGTFSKQNYDAYQSEVVFLAPCVARAIVEVLNPASVVDLGCGLGIYLGALAYLGVEVKGYEFSPDAITYTEAPEGVVEYHDLREPLDAGRRYDMALCCQVAEHLEWRFSAHLVELVTNLSDVVFWSAARPGSGGQHHVNEQWPPFWHELFEGRGYIEDESLTERMKAAIRKRCPRVGWGHHIYTDCVMYVRQGSDWEWVSEQVLTDRAEVWKRLAEHDAWEAASDEALTKFEKGLEVIPHG